MDVSLYEGIFRMEEAMIAQYDLFGTVRERSPMPSGASCPIGTFETKDHRYVIIVCSTNPVFEHLCDAMERPDWLPKYAKAKERLADPKPIMDAVTRVVHQPHLCRTQREVRQGRRAHLLHLQHEGHF